MKFANVVCICLALAGSAYAPAPSLRQQLFGGGGKESAPGEDRTYTHRTVGDIMFGRKKESGLEPDLSPLTNGLIRKKAGALDENSPLRNGLIMNAERGNVHEHVPANFRVQAIGKNDGQQAPRYQGQQRPPPGKLFLNRIFRFNAFSWRYYGEQS